MGIYTYSPTEVDLIVAGYNVKGWNSIAVSRSATAFTLVRGIRGKNTRVRNRDTSAVIFIDVARTSPVNTVFSEVVRQDLIYGTGRLEILLKDKYGTSLYSSNEAFIDKHPDDAFTTELNNRRWTITCQSTSEWNVGGNESAQESLFSNVSNAVKDGLGSVKDGVGSVVDKVGDIFN